MKILQALKKIIPVLIILAVLLLESAFLNSNENEFNPKVKTDPPFSYYRNNWVDSVFNTMTLDEKIGQLFSVQAYSNKGQEHIDQVVDFIKTYKVGSISFFQGGPVRQANLTNYLQSISDTPLLIATDGEWGLSMRLDSTIDFPRQVKLGAIKNNDLIYEMGAEIGRQMNRIGVHMNFAPVIDVNNNPNNPVIGFRSFGADRENVAKKGLAYMSGLQDKHVIATAKHFPGHGDTDSDSHYKLPVINHSRSRLDSIELYPFKYLIDGGLTAVMSGHLSIPVLDSTKNLASSLSRKIITGLLKEELGFKGLIITDGLGMSGVSKYYTQGEIAVKALMAGNDILLLCKDVPNSIEAIKQAIDDGLLSEAEIDYKCRKVLMAKKWVGLDNYKPIKIDSIYEDLNTRDAKYLNRRLIESSSSLLKNENNILPLKKLDSLKIACFSIGVDSLNAFQKSIGLYADVDYFQLKNASPNILDMLIQPLSKYNTVIVGIHNAPRNSVNYNEIVQTARIGDFINQLSKKTNVVLNVFADIYSLNLLDTIDNTKAILMSYDDSDLSQDVAAQIMFGGTGSSGKLPVSVSENFAINTGIEINKRTRLKYSVPEEFNIDMAKIARIDSLALKAIEDHATPGCQILAAKNGVVFYNKSFGYHTYDKKIPVRNSDIYDLASVTKVSATLPALMILNEQHKFDLNENISKYIDILSTSNKSEIKNIDVLTHQARLRSWIPFHIRAMRQDSINHVFSCTKLSNQRIVAENFYIKSNYKDSVFSWISKSSLRRRKSYRYSDLGFYLYQEAVEKLSHSKLDEFVYNNFYKKLGAVRLCYKPIDKFPISSIIPTENDKLFRHQLVHGYVHDQGAAMLGGVAGHAGLFSNANDLAKLMQMYLQKGQYGDEKYLNSETIELFTSCPFCKKRGKKQNRRGIGFDKPYINGHGNSSISWLSGKSFGHTGFTGTMVWVDPETEILYVFLSNRVCPDAENKKLQETRVRQNIHKTIYEALGEI